MYADVVAMTTAALKNASWGINAQITNMITGSLCAASVPTITTITDELSDITVARGYPAPSTPSIAVAADGNMDVESEIRTNYRDFKPTIEVRIAVERSDTQNGTGNMYAYQRAFGRCLRAFMDNSNFAARSLNGIQIFDVEANTLRVWSRHSSMDNNIVVGSITLQYMARDTQV